MEHTAYRQIRSVFGIASIPNTEFGSITPNKCSIVVIGLRVNGNTTHSISPNYVSIWD